MSKTSLCSGEEAFVGTTMDSDFDSDSDSDDHSGVEEELQVEEGREHIILRWTLVYLRRWCVMK